MQAARGASLNARGSAESSAVGAAADGAHNARPRRVRTFAVVAAIVYVCDIVTKVLAVEHLTGRDPVEVVPGVLSLTLVRNPGAAFSLGTGLTVVLTGVALVVVVVVLRMSGRLRDRGWAVALGLLLGGALGNLTDRLLREPGPLRGHVVDFLALPHWPVFNVADSAITVAAVLVASRALRGVGLDGHRSHPS